MDNSQEARIIAHLSRGKTLTALDASRWNPPILRLAARIHRLRTAVRIESHLQRRGSKSWSVYRLARTL